MIIRLDFVMKFTYNFRMELKTINLKEVALSAEDAGIICKMEIEQAELEGLNAIKFIHGYGSHGVGGAKLIEVRKICKWLESHKKIEFFIAGYDWNTQNPKALNILLNNKNYFNDVDLNHSNPGITIVKLKN